MEAEARREILHKEAAAVAECFPAPLSPYFAQTLLKWRYSGFSIDGGILAITRDRIPASSPWTWARLIAKIYRADPKGGSRFDRSGESPFICPRCGNSMRVLAVITEPSQLHRILRHLIKIGRAPPGLLLAPLH